MMKAPNKIWAQSCKNSDGILDWDSGDWGHQPESDGEVQYIRADLVENLVETLRGVINACNQGKMVPRLGCGVGGMTIDANIRGSVYIGVPAWPIEEAQDTIAKWENIK